ncbi:hypothetical protein FSP39_017928 [Pinctada imbricata]|uniref:G-protein coupled receptors family 1 profile domain-containing protein n=1 Tax=Pinctada imbricata TaxID=66713 RepID=A0AA89C7P6_PINIB|nr:hypothetical protein FSP39_017928 [Pinctada imbricata]
MEHMRHNESLSMVTLNDTCTGGEDDGIYYRFLCIAEHLAPVSVIIDRYVTPLWYLIGIVGNTLTIKIWSRRMQRSTSAIYLTVLAITDLFLILLHILMELKFAWNLPTLDVRGWCQTFFMMFMFNQYMSPLLILGFTFERFISIALPFKSDRFAHFNRAPIEIGIITFVAALLSIPQLFGWEFINKDCQGTETYTFFSTWTWVSDILIFCVFPIASLILNILVIRVVKQSLKLRRRSAPGSFYSSTSSRRSARHFTARIHISTLTLLCISFYRILTVIPVAIIFALQFVIKHGDPTLTVYEMSKDSQWIEYFRYITAKKVIDEIGLTQYSCNILYISSLPGIFAMNFSETFVLFVRVLRNGRNSCLSGFEEVRKVKEWMVWMEPTPLCSH